MKKPLSIFSQSERTKLFLWRRGERHGSQRERINLLAGLAFLLVLLLICVWIGLTRQLHTKSQTVTATSPSTQVEPPRRDSSLVYDPIHRIVLLFGGTLLTSNGAQINETWTWDGQSWRQQHPAVSPPALQGTLVYDAASRQILLFLTQVQSGGDVANEMWTWDGTNWHQLHPASMPEVLGASMAYDAARGQVLLFGGEIPGAGPQNDTLTNATWSWNGTTWQEQHPATSPSPRTGTTMAYNAIQQQIMLYGGTTQAGLSSETWIWNGITWQQQQSARTLPPRQHALLIYDNATQQMLLFGGINAAGTQSAPGDTWIWHNNDWVQVSVTGAPPDIYKSAVYDEATRSVVVYAVQGFPNKLEQPNTSAPTSQTWIWNGTIWKLLH